MSKVTDNLTEIVDSLDINSLQNLEQMKIHIYQIPNVK